jgi:anti-anti-sigma factor
LRKFLASAPRETGRKKRNVTQPPFEIDSVRDGQTGRLTLTGELDIATVPRAQEAVDGLLAGGVQRLVIDLSGLGFVDSSGLRLFIVLDRRAAAQGWALGLIRPRGAAMTVFEVSGAEENLPFVEDASLA